MFRKNFFPILLISISVFLLLSQLLNSFSIAWMFWDFWPIILILLGLDMMTRREERRSILGLFISTIGSIFLIDNLNIFYHFHPSDIIFPISLLFLGIYLFNKNMKGNKNNPEFKVASDNINSMDYINVQTFFSGSKKQINSIAFTGGEVNSIFSGVTIDLRQSSLSNNGGILDLTSVFGSIDILIPYDWNIHIDSNALFGSVVNSTNNITDTTKPYLLIKGNAIFGEVKLMN